MFIYQLGATPAGNDRTQALDLHVDVPKLDVYIETQAL